MNGVRYTKPVRTVDDIKYLTVVEQETFLEAAKHSHNYRQYALLLETGLRTAEWFDMGLHRHITDKLLVKAVQLFEAAAPPVRKRA